MKKEINGKMEKVSEFRGGGGGRSFGGGRPMSFSRPSGVIIPNHPSQRPMGVTKPARNHPASFHPTGYRHRNYPRGYRRQFWGVGGGWLVWNGVYWIDPFGVCYFENDYGDYVQANCIAHDPIAQLQPDVLLFSGVDGKNKSQAVEHESFPPTKEEIIDINKKKEDNNNSFLFEISATIVITGVIMYLFTRKK